MLFRSWKICHHFSSRLENKSLEPGLWLGFLTEASQGVQPSISEVTNIGLKRKTLFVYYIFNRPGVAGTDLESPPLLIDLVGDPFVQNL